MLLKCSTLQGKYRIPFQTFEISSEEEGEELQKLNYLLFPVFFKQILRASLFKKVKRLKHFTFLIQKNLLYTIRERFKLNFLLVNLRTIGFNPTTNHSTNLTDKV